MKNYVFCNASRFEALANIYLELRCPNPQRSDPIGRNIHQVHDFNDHDIGPFD